jgi:hypothetical protein
MILGWLKCGIQRSIVIIGGLIRLTALSKERALIISLDQFMSQISGSDSFLVLASSFSLVLTME